VGKDRPGSSLLRLVGNLFLKDGPVTGTVERHGNPEDWMDLTDSVRCATAIRTL